MNVYGTVHLKTLHQHLRLSKSTFTTQLCPNPLLYYSVFINTQLAKLYSMLHICETLIVANQKML